VNQTQLPEKDAEAEEMLQQTLGRNPDALYIMAQTVLVQGYALEQAQKQLADARAQLEQMRQQAAQPKHATSFLGNLLGMKEDEPARAAVAPPPPPQAQYAPVPAYPPAPGYTPVPGYAPAGYGAPLGYGAPQQGGFLRSAMQTATGVAAGALAFEGIESLMHGFGHSAGYGGFGGVGDFGGSAPREEIVNNYYGDAAPGTEHAGHAEHSDFLSQSSDSGSSVDRSGDSSSRFSDAVYRDDSNAGVADAPSGNDDLGADAGANDPSTYADDSSTYTDDSGGGDDGGGFDSGGGDGSF
jgi:hypothetical protein